MAFVRPIVYVYQEFQNITVAPGVPDLNCLIVGPVFHIEDYPTDKSNIGIGDFIKSGYTKDAPCDSTGTSLGRPDPGSDFITLSDPPNHTAGATLDSSSVKVYFTDALIEVAKGDDGAISDNSNIFTSAGADFSGKDADGNDINANGTQKIKAGDRIVLTIDSGTTTVVKQVSYVVSSTQLALTSTKKTTEAVGDTSINWRIEHELDDQEIDTDYYAINGNQITIKTGPTGILLAYEGSSYPVNYADMYIGYRELRTDLDHVITVDSSDDITTTFGKIDERNPMAAALQVAFANTSNPIQAFGVDADTLAGHQAARDKITTRDDIYCIVPVTDSLSKSDWVSIISMWKSHCVDYAAYDKAKFRVVIGSYDDLPEEKASAPASTTGYTLEDANETGNSVFVDPASGTDFVTAEVDSNHLLDVTQTATSGLPTCNNEKHLFSESGYNGAKELLGAIGGKRLRLASGSVYSSDYSGEAVSYLVRSPILKSEGVSASVIYADVTGATWGDDGGVNARITKTGAFSNVSVGDVAHVSGGTTGAHNDGFIITAVDPNGNYIDLTSTEITADTVNLQVYRPVANSVNSNITSGTRTITASGSSDFANVAIGDLCIVLQSGTASNAGMWVVENKLDDQNVVIGDPGSTLVTASGTNVVFFRTVASSPSASITIRKRLTRLRDDNASFTTTVEAGEYIEIPYPEDTDPTKWDTSTTRWPIETVVSDELLDAQLDDLEELAPEAFIAGYNGDMPYRIAIDLTPSSQVTELNTITTSLKDSRCVMVWPNEVYVSNLTNQLTGVQNKQSGQYLACAVGGMVSSLPSHQGFTYLGIGGIQQIFNSNFYFTDAQLTSLRDGGWYVFVQDSESSLPYTIHEVTTDVSSYEFGEFMNVKNFDYIALALKEVLDAFVGRYNINTENLELVRTSLNARIQYLKKRVFPKIGAPLLSGEITSIQQLAEEKDRAEVNIDVELPKIMNKIGLHLISS